MIDFQRYLLIGAIALLSYMLLVEWGAFRQQARDNGVAEYQQPVRDTAEPVSDELPMEAPSARPVDGRDVDVEIDSRGVRAAEASQVASISVTTDVLDVRISLTGGDIVYAALPKHLETLDRREPFVLLEDSQRRSYIAQSGLVGPDGTDSAEGRPTYQVDQRQYTLRENEKSLQVDLVYHPSEDITITKRYHFERGRYYADVEYLVDNRSDSPWQAAMFGQMRRDNSADPSASDNFFAMKPFLGVAYRTEDSKYEKLRFDRMTDRPLNFGMPGGWIAMMQHYFVSAWIPAAESYNQYSTVVTRAGFNIARFTGETVTVAADSQGSLGAKLYVGPKYQYDLADLAEGLELTVDYGWLWWIAQPLFWLLTKIFALVGNWGWSIILVTVLIKALFFKLNATAFRSMANMRRVQPKLVDIRERYSDDRQKQSQAMMELYKKEKINPLGGCLPILVQMPVFIALYWVLMESVELRHAPWIGWIQDLSAMDPWFILPLLMGASMWVQQKLNPPPPDPMQAKIMQWLPVIFTFFFLFFPAGLVLYWVVNNLLSIIQQYIITRGIENADKNAKAK